MKHCNIKNNCPFCKAEHEETEMLSGISRNIGVILRDPDKILLQEIKENLKKKRLFLTTKQEKENDE